MEEFLYQANDGETIFDNYSSNCLNSKISHDEAEIKCGEIVLIANKQIWFSCSFCNERFDKIVTFLNHIKNIHLKENPELISCKNEDSMDFNPMMELQDDDDDDADAEVYNPQQNYEYVSVEDDTKSELRDSDDMNSKNIDNNNSDSSQLNAPESPNTTLICKKIVGLVSPTKKIRKKRNRKKKIYQCSICEHIARDSITLESHMRAIHKTGTRHQCWECGKCFANGANLRTHLVIHSGTRPYKCEFCTAAFAHSNSLKTHRYLHTGDRPYKCPECDRRFTTNGGLKYHIREHTGEQPYACEICEKRFASQSAHKRHTMSHKGERAFACTLCEKAFVHKPTLDKHMVCHSNERNFVCDICEKTFAHKKNLVQHKKLHDDVKTYICKICHKDFAQYAGLYSHMKYHNKDSD